MLQINIQRISTYTTGKTDFSKEFKTPIGLWTLVLYSKHGAKLEPKQMITRDYGDNGYTMFTDLDTDSFSLIDKDLIVPMINFLPAKGYMVKEILRIKFFFRGEPQQLSPKNSNTASDAVTKTFMKNFDTNKNKSKTINNRIDSL